MPFARGSHLFRDAYAVLGIRRGASEAEVRAAWRDVARRTHPDVGGDAAAFRRAREAYETLIDPERRAAQDRLLDARSAPAREDAFRGRTTTAPPGPWPGAGPRSSRRPAASDRRGDRRWEWTLLALNVVVVLRAIALLRGGEVGSWWAGTLSFRPPAGGVALWVTTTNLLGVPWLFLVLGALAVSLLVAELVHERSGGAPLLDVEQRAAARFVQTALPVPLVIGAVLLIVAIVVQLVIMALAVAAFIAVVRFVLFALDE